MGYVPTKIFFTKGVGKASSKLMAFEKALRDAGIQACNLVCVSSILPPNAKIIKKEEGLSCLKPGQITHVVMARMEDNEPNRLLVSSIGCAIPKDNGTYGYLSEHHCAGLTDEKAGDYAEDLAASMLASTLGIEFDPDSAWCEKEKMFQMSGKFIRTFNTTQSAVCDKDGKWTAVVAVAVLLE